MYKVIELLKRSAGFSIEDFHRRWLDRHGPVRSTLPGLRRYVQSHTLLKGYSKGELLFDGIHEMWFDDKDAFEAARTSAAWRTAQEDMAVFVDASRTILMRVDVYVITDGDIPKNAVKNIEFVNRRPGMELDGFRAYWTDVHGPLAATIPPLRRYEQNHLARDSYDAGEPPFDGLAITWFESTDAMKEGTKTPEYRKTRADEPHFLPDGHLPIIITREHVVYPPRTEVR